MNFASWPFLFGFLPAALALFHLSRGPRADDLRALILIAASLLFYLAAGWRNAAVMAVSLTVTWAAGRWLSAMPKDRDGRRSLVMWLAVFANTGLLAGFKIEALALSSTDGFRTAEQILIPLGLSYVTFQQIGFIVACRRGQIEKPGVRDYLFFITFFPHLLMGPIVRFQDMARQLRDRALTSVRAEDVGVGLGIFTFGLAQKVLLADQIAPAADRVFLAAQNGPITPLEGWFGIVAFQLQLFFDFVAYADMAIGLARMFGVRLPVNFDRPLFAVDRFDLWRRWHITFAIFMRTHVFQPLARKKGVPIWGALAVTGLLSGLWHGLGWTFVVWGLIQTAILLAVHWRRTRLRKSGRKPLPLPLAIAATFLVSCLIGAMFRAPTLDSAAHVYGSLIGVGAATEGGLLGLRALIMLPLCVLVAWGLPSSAQLFHRYWTALDLRPDPTPVPAHPLGRFSLTLPWALATAALLVLCLCLMGEARRFVYVQF